MSFRTIHITAGPNVGKTTSAVYAMLGAFATRPHFKTALVALGEVLPAPCAEVLEGKDVVVVENGGAVESTQYDVVVDDGYSHLTKTKLEPMIKDGGLLIVTRRDCVDMTDLMRAHNSLK